MRTPTSRSAAPPAVDRVGLGITLFAAIILGLATTAARFAYQGGSNGPTVVTGRCLLFALVMTVFFLATRRSMAIGGLRWLECAGIGVLIGMMVYGNIGAAEFIPIGLVALLHFTFPPVTVVLAVLFLRTSLPPVKALTIAVAFLGLALMLGTSVATMDWRGVALGLMASLATSINNIWYSRRLARVDPYLVLLHAGWVAAVILPLLALATTGLAAPATPAGWAGFAGVGVLQSTGLMLYYLSLRWVGPVTSAMIFNVQPVVSVIAAYLAFGEVLTAWQGLGGALVIGSVWAMTWADGRRARRGA